MCVHARVRCGEAATQGDQHALVCRQTLGAGWHVTTLPPWPIVRDVELFTRHRAAHDLLACTNSCHAGTHTHRLSSTAQHSILSSPMLRAPGDCYYYAAARCQQRSNNTGGSAIGMQQRP